MTFRVVIAKRAKDDLRRYFLLAAEHAPMRRPNGWTASKRHSNR